MKKITIGALEILVDLSWFLVAILLIGSIALIIAEINNLVVARYELVILMLTLWILAYVPSFLSNKVRRLAKNWGVSLKSLKELDDTSKQAN
jgi:hypothetical protein